MYKTSAVTKDLTYNHVASLENLMPRYKWNSLKA